MSASALTYDSEARVAVLQSGDLRIEWRDEAEQVQTAEGTPEDLEGLMRRLSARGYRFVRV